MENSHRNIWTGDIETDPFAFGTTIDAFLVILTNGDRKKIFWGDSAIRQAIDFLLSIDIGKIYFHNGGKFDFHFFLRELKTNETGNFRIFGNRIYSLDIGQNTLTDSYPLAPFSLSTLNKIDIDFDLLTRQKRERNKKQIIDYCINDCMILRKWICNHRDTFGHIDLTISRTAHRILCKHFNFPRLQTHPARDRLIRPWYLGGRTQAFLTSDQETPFVEPEYADINSAYPSAMRSAHPISRTITRLDHLPDHQLYFAHVTAHANGHFPARENDGTLSFPTDGIHNFHLTAPEIQMAENLGILKIERVNSVIAFRDCITFAEYVNTFHKLKNQATDETQKKLYKLLLNATYGRFGINPATFTSIDITPAFEHREGWTVIEQCVNPDFQIITKDEPPKSDTEYWDNKGNGQFVDVAVAASITGHVRATMMAAIHTADMPIYCDTDSLFAHQLRVVMGDEIGAWKPRRVDKLWVAGKKKYIVAWKDGDTEIHCNGGSLDFAEGMHLCNGDKVSYQRDAPTLSINGDVKYIERIFSV